MSLVLCLTENIIATGNIVVLNSCLCVMRNLVDINKKGVYGENLINNGWYWKCYIDGKRITYHLTNKSVGDVDSLYDETDNVLLLAFDIKEEDYAMMMLSTYGTNEKVGEDK